MTQQEPIRHIDITPTPEEMQHIARMFQQQIASSQEKIIIAKELQEKLWDNEIYLDHFDREQNKLLAEALDLGLDRIITQEEGRIQNFQAGLGLEEGEE